MKKKFLSILAAFAVLVSFSACQAGDTGQMSPLSEAVVSETTEVEVTTQTEKDYSDYEEFPEGWSAERVLNMISIDGHQLSFPCTVDDILALSEDFEIRNEMYHNDTQKVAWLCYKNVEVASIGYYNDKKIYYANFDDYFQNGYINVENININETEKIISLFESLMNVSSKDSALLSSKLTDLHFNINVEYYTLTNSIIISWEEVL